MSEIVTATGLSPNIMGRSDADTARSGAAAAILGRMERLPLSGWHLRTRAIIGTATFFDAFDFLTVALALPVLSGLWHLTPVQIGMLISSSLFGQFLGSIAFGFIADRIGRIPATTITVLLFGALGVACALSWDFYSLFAFRFLQGVGMGAEVPIAASYVNEIAPAKSRGRFVLLYEFIFAIGVFAAGLLGRWCIPTFGWQSVFWIGAVPALLIAPAIAVLPESPRWLVGRGRLADAEKAMERIERAVSRGGRELPPAVPALATVIGNGTVRELLSGPYRKRTIVMWLVWICIGLVSWPLTTWLPSIFRTVYHLSVETALTYGLITTSGAIIAGTFTCALLIDAVGRRRWFTMAFAIAAAATLVLGLAGMPSVDMVLILAAVTMFFISSMNLAIYVYTPELYPTRLRAVGVSLCAAWSRAAAMIAPPVIGWWLSHGGLSSVFLVMGGFAVLGAVVTVLFAEETRHRVLEEVSP